MMKNQTVLKPFKGKVKITSINYGPFDNGHVLVGLDNGTLISFSTIDLVQLNQIVVFNNSPINSITFEPT
jgi:hypothetical protein